jgi:hypothetical protein
MDKKKVYLSSTQKDLAEHRDAVKAALERAQFDVACMEKYPAFDERPKDKCLADVAACDYYVRILAWRYGFQPKDGNPKKLSITHLEYRQALECGKPCFAFLLDPEHPWPPPRFDPDAFSPDSEIGQFRQAVEAAHGRRVFTTPDSLAAAVLEALRAEEQKGWTGEKQAQARVREEYLAWLRGSCESVELLGLDLKESQNVRLGQVYVPAVASAQRAGSPNEPRHELLLHRLGEQSLYVPGDPGAGKSTFCRWLALLAAGGAVPAHRVAAPQEFEEKLPDALRGRFPLLCRLPGRQRPLEPRRAGGQPVPLAGKGPARRLDAGGVPGGAGRGALPVDPRRRGRGAGDAGRRASAAPQPGHRAGRRAARVAAAG